MSSRLFCGVGVRNMNVLPSHFEHMKYRLFLAIVPLTSATFSLSISTGVIALQFMHTSSHSTDTGSCISHYLLRTFCEHHFFSFNALRCSSSNSLLSIGYSSLSCSQV